jgi:hypothetical protein
LTPAELPHPIRWDGENPLSAAEIHRQSPGKDGDEHEIHGSVG